MIKVDKSVKPIHYSKRIICNLIVGNKYYVSFGRNQVHECTLLEIDSEGEPPKVTVELKGGAHHLYSNELGDTPEQAVINTVTS